MIHNKYAKANPDAALELIETYCRMGKNSRREVGEYCRTIAYIAKEHPQNAGKAFSALQPFLESTQNHDGPSLMEASLAIGSIVKSDPKLSEKGLDAIQKVLELDRFRYYHIVESIKYPLKVILKNKPDLANDAFKMLDSPLVHGVQLGEYSVTSVGEIAEHIAEANPEMANKMQAFVSKCISYCNPNDELDIEGAKESLQRIKNSAEKKIEGPLAKVADKIMSNKKVNE